MYSTVNACACVICACVSGCTCVCMSLNGRSVCACGCANTFVNVCACARVCACACVCSVCSETGKTPSSTSLEFRVFVFVSGLVSVSDSLSGTVVATDRACCERCACVCESACVVCACV